MAVYSGRLLLVEEHRSALASGARAVGFPESHPAWTEAARTLAASLPDGMLRVFLTAGGGTVTDPVSPNLFAWFEPGALPATAEPGAGRAEIVEISSASGPWPKSGNYWGNIAAHRSAVAGGCSDAVLVAADHAIPGAAMANLFAVMDGELVTPPPGAATRAGAVRAWVLARRNVIERPIVDLRMLLSASEIFLTNSRVGIRPLVVVAGKEYPVGPVARSLWTEYLSDVLGH